MGPNPDKPSPAAGFQSLLSRPKDLVPPPPDPPPADVEPELLPTWESPEPAPAAPADQCPACRSARTAGQDYCGDCGWIFQASGAAADPAPPPTRVNQRYDLGELL